MFKQELLKRLKLYHVNFLPYILFTNVTDLPGPSKKRPPLKKQITDDDIQSRLDALKREI